MAQDHFEILYVNRESLILRQSTDTDIPAVRRLVNSAYQELAPMGLNYTATYQDEEITRDRIKEGRAFVLERNGRILATVLFRKRNLITKTNSAFISLAVEPTLKRAGIGSRLMGFVRSWPPAKVSNPFNSTPPNRLVIWSTGTGDVVTRSLARLIGKAKPMSPGFSRKESVKSGLGTIIGLRAGVLCTNFPTHHIRDL